MSSERIIGRLQDIRDNIAYAREFIGTMPFEDFAQDLKVVYATVRALEIISEASRHLPAALKKRHPLIDWLAVRDAGNVYRHAYELVTERRVWDTVTMHLEPLDKAVSAELAILTPRG
jgi:uncharacterized protein with HEPN domain